jgi:hypothetical protein
MSQTNEQARMKAWTLMFYFASDNPLAPGIVSQLKAIKQAGFHHDANVIAQFDPQPEGTPTHIFDVNYVKKLEVSTPQIGYTGYSPDDPFVHTLLDDKLWRDDLDNEPQLNRHDESIKQQFRQFLKSKGIHSYNPPEPPLGRKPVPDAPTCVRCGEVFPEPKHDCKRPAPAKCHRRTSRTRELNPQESLGAFLDFCRREYPARHYMLFLLGHGVVVGNDVFLYDENADQQSLKLKDLGVLLKKFKDDLPAGAEFELVSFHSCSVSSLEVAYELHDTANFMLASQGPAFIGSWPYRQILTHVFGQVDCLKELEKTGTTGQVRARVKEMLRVIFKLCYHNSTDYLMAGYSFDLCLCNLRRVTDVKEPLRRLTKALREGLTDPLIKGLVLLAHWEAQSQWQENYTDLHDFCFCLRRQYRKLKEKLEEEGEERGVAARVLGATYLKLQNIAAECRKVMTLLEAETPGGPEKMVYYTHFAGPGHQYSHGLSVFFPWSEPVTDKAFMRDYEDYKFAETRWLDFLTDYFARTMRHPHKVELAQEKEEADEESPDSRPAVSPGYQSWLTPQMPDVSPADEMYEDMRSLAFGGDGRPGGEGSPTDTLKIGSKDPTGDDDCTCGSIKNYPRDTRPRHERHSSVFVALKSPMPASRRSSVQKERQPGG